ncbi:efflux transporter periplasmic adaptor subunit [Rhodoplanes elegans]|uniref:Efflux transporter periplasmic adaptor subunit n=1 Tax=Rhodoplanes elegans TaxID=29408 RepID=A0A327KV24_9BRAD|nr:efflux RND transporter periplasmic adaptor subunit [Rhodoplanes elegans]MBK5958401.1 efflux transporter periplasmic adaptor subunit [Rhodoplanes elegans]RAI42057.1 efflux transporter periplasmic adaptor subunit [Rhodoplanes elegans]
MPRCQPAGSAGLSLRALAAALAATLTACGDASVVPAAAPSARPEVGVVTVQAASVTLTKELPGRITPMRIAEVRPRVSGIVVERSFQQGSVVEAGAVLYRIDPAPFQVELDKTKAALAKAEAVLYQASRQEDRLRTLLPAQATSQAQYELAVAAERQAEAEVAAQKAAVGQAQLNLDWATVRAPITGRIGRALVTEGALVSPNETTHLATIQQLDPIYADFTQSVGELNQLRRDLAEGRLKSVSPEAARVRLLLDDGAVYRHAGRLLFSDVSVDPGTAKVTLRGEFPNPDADLLPGMYVRVQIEEAIDTDGIVIPAQAVQRTTAGGSAVFVVNGEGRAMLHPVRAGRTLAGGVLIEDGLTPGWRVVVDGFQKFAPGDAVTPVPWRSPGSGPPAAPN